jgi:hypothetical protein
MIYEQPIFRWGIFGLFIWSLLGAGCTTGSDAENADKLTGSQTDHASDQTPESPQSAMQAARAWLGESPSEVGREVRWLLERIRSRGDGSAAETAGRIERIVRTDPDTYVAVVSAGGERAVHLTLQPDDSGTWRVTSADNGRSSHFWPRVGG